MKISDLSPSLKMRLMLAVGEDTGRLASFLKDPRAKDIVNQMEHDIKMASSKRSDLRARYAEIVKNLKGRPTAKGIDLEADRLREESEGLVAHLTELREQEIKRNGGVKRVILGQEWRSDIARANFERENQIRASAEAKEAQENNVAPVQVREATPAQTFEEWENKRSISRLRVSE